MLKFLTRLFERRAEPRWRTSQALADFEAIFGDGGLSSGVTVTPERALTIPAVFACVQVLSQDVARTPLKLRRRVGEGAYEDAVDHDLFELLHDLPNPEQTAYGFKAALMLSQLTYGRAYAEIVRREGRVVALWPLDARMMRVDREPGTRRKRWTYAAGGQTMTWLFDPSTPPVFELVHETPIARCRELIGIALALQR
ncbi:MAG: phage portal protein, partial [Candidatus Polarisedimenticolia bacterium]